MPVESKILNLHQQVPGAVEGYELAPGTTGLWSIVSPSGTVTNLNSLGLQVLAYMGAGMPPVENITSPYGILGGSLLQRTVIRPRAITLTCIVQSTALASVQRLKSAIIAQIAPYNSLSSSKVIKLHYQLVNFCGDLIGAALEVAVTYAGDLTGQTTNLYQDRFDLQFVEFNPPSIKELTTTTTSLLYNTPRTSVTGIRYRVATTGEWKFISLAGSSAAHYDANGELWYASNATITNRSGTGTQAVNNFVFAIAHDQNNNIYAGGSFTTPQSYIMKYSSGAWGAVGATINGLVYGLAFDNLGNLYAAGQFTTPIGGIGKWDGATWAALGTGTNGTVYSIVKGLDGYIYIAGGFTTANGVACNNIAKWDPVLATFVPLGAGTNGAIRSLAVLPDGRIVAGGSFTTAGGVACSCVAVWNGTQWQPLGNGLNTQVYKLSVNQTNGDIYATGLFNASGSLTITSRFGKFNGSLWVPQDSNNDTSSLLTNQMDIRANDGELALSTDIAAGNVSNGTLNTVTYTGTADVFPRIKFTGPGILNVITNYTTGKSIYFNNYTLLAGETATFTHDPSSGITFVSSFFGNVIGRILPGSDSSTFSLVPGANSIVPYITSVTGATLCQLLYENTHYSFEAGSL